MTLLRSCTPAAFAFLLSVAISHVILPAFGRANVIPFFSWQLYDKTYLREPAFDLILIKDHQPTFLSRQKQSADLPKIRLWYFTQLAGQRILAHEDPRFSEANLRAELAGAKMEAAALVVVTAPLYQYMLLPPEDLPAHTQVLFNFN